MPPVVPDERALGPKGGPTELALVLLAAAVRYHVGLEDAALWGGSVRLKALQWIATGRGASEPLVPGAHRFEGLVT